MNKSLYITTFKEVLGKAHGAHDDYTRCFYLEEKRINRVNLFSGNDFKGLLYRLKHRIYGERGLAYVNSVVIRIV